VLHASRRSAFKLLGLVFGLASLLTAMFLMAASYGWTEERRVAAAIDAYASEGHGRISVGLAVVALLVADLALPIPSSLVMTLAGRFLGTGAGFACNLSGSLGASFLGYFLCRRFGRGAFARLFGSEDTRQAEALFSSFGPWAIALSRPVPMLTEIVSCLAGLTAMEVRSFVGLSVLGTAPISLAYAWLGHEAKEPLGLQWPLVIAFLLPAGGLLAAWLFGHSRRAAPPKAG
jgi:uncharacterized membrane protein YdjX (TVP38/TMEM64 family)